MASQPLFQQYPSHVPGVTFQACQADCVRKHREFQTWENVNLVPSLCKGGEEVLERLNNLASATLFFCNISNTLQLNVTPSAKGYSLGCVNMWLSLEIKGRKCSNDIIVTLNMPSIGTGIILHFNSLHCFLQL